MDTKRVAFKICCIVELYSQPDYRQNNVFVVSVYGSGHFKIICEIFIAQKNHV